MFIGFVSLYIFHFLFHFAFEINVQSAFKYGRVDGHVLNKASPSKTTDVVQKTMSKTVFFTTLYTCDCPGLLFCLHFVLTYIHFLVWLSALCMPAQHSRGPPGEQTHTGGYGAVPQSLLPPPSHSHSVCLLLSHHHVPAYMPRQSAL